MDRGVRLDEIREQAVDPVGRDADAGILDGDAQRCAGRIALDAMRRDDDIAGRRELDGIAREVEQDLTDAARIADQCLGQMGAASIESASPFSIARIDTMLLVLSMTDSIENGTR